jgi:hypothetical protein
LNWLSYRNGSAHLMNKRSSFAGTETWEQIDFATRFQPQASPAVLARSRYAGHDALRCDGRSAKCHCANTCDRWRPRFDDETRGERANSRRRSDSAFAHPNHPPNTSASSSITRNSRRRSGNLCTPHTLRQPVAA